MTTEHTPSRTVAPEALQGIYLFRALDPQDLDTMVRATERLYLEQGQRLFNQGDPIRRFFYVESGRMKLYRLSGEGSEKVLDLVGGGSTFAEAVVFMDSEAGYPVNADAIEPTTLFGFDAPTYLGLLKHSNESCLQLLGAMSKRLRWQVNEIDRLTLQNATSRFVGFVLNPGSASFVDDDRVELNVPKNVLASRLSIQPETFSRILKRLSAAGLIRVDRQRITLLDVDKLRELLETPN